MEIIIPVLQIFYWGLIIYCLLSFIRTPQTIEMQRVLGKVYRPLLDPISKMLEPLQKGMMGLDFSPIVLILLINFVMKALVNL